jgi:predicted Zn finger-like uncharacterized protein
MTITCPECHTRFSLDDSRIQGPTAKVRCSRCRHVFKINKDGQVLAADLGPKAAAPAAPPPAPEPVPEPVAPGFDPGSMAASGMPPEPGPIPGEGPAHPRPWRPWLKIAAPILAVVLLGGLFWLAWTGHLGGPFKPVSDLVQRLKRKPTPPKEPAPAPGAATRTPSPAPTVVTAPPVPTPPADLTDLAVDWAQAHYQGLINDKGGGQLLLVQGEVVNKGTTPRGPVRLKATLTDAQHHPLREELVYAGTTLSDADAKTLPPEEIKGWLTKPGGRSQEPVIKPGEKEPFTVVFFGVPGNLAETQSGFQLVVVEAPVAH